MTRRGFTFLEVLIALAILAVLSASLMPLMTGLAVSDRRVRLRAEAWRTAQSALTARYAGDTAGWKALQNGRFRIELEPHPAAGAAWNKMTVTPAESEKPILELYVESGTFRTGGSP